MAKNVGILAYAADPPHLGHELLTEQALSFGRIDEVWLLPVYRFAQGKTVASAEGRLEMSRLTARPRVKSLALEIARERTFDYFTAASDLTKMYPGVRLQFLTGADLVAERQYLLWKYWGKLNITDRFLVLPRPGYPLTGRLPRAFKLLEHRDLVTSNITSAAVREWVKRRAHYAPLVTASVAEYIREHRVYS